MKKTLIKLTGVIFLLLITLNGCKKDDPTPDPVIPMVSAGKQITFFKAVTPAITGVLDTVNKKITLPVPAGTNVTSIVTDISLATGYTISPLSGVAQNFTNPVVYTVKCPNNTTTQWTVSVTSLGVTVDQDITQSVTWSADKVYTINGDVEVSNNSILTIQPGTVIKFAANASLTIGYSGNATLIADGTAALPIVFTSTAIAPAAGAWKGLFFYDKTLNNTSLTYCNIQYAGSNSNYGAINLIGCDIAINNSNVANSASFGIATNYQNSKGGFVSFANNTISTTSKYGLTIDAHKAGTIGAGNTFTNCIGVLLSGDYRSSTSQTWRKLSVPYIIASEIDIDGALTVEAGATFKFESTGWMAIGYYESTTFIADGGSATTPITFTSTAVSPAAGAWRGVAFYGFAQTNSKMNHCIIEYAGNNSTYGALDMNNNASIIFTNNIIRNSGSFGVNLDWDAGFQSFTNNTVSGCANHVIVINTKHLPELGSPNVLTAAAGKGIEVSGEYQYPTPVIWKKQTCDFYVKGGELDVDGMITIEAGTTFRFVNDSYFWFGYYASTKITAIGTSTNKITFTSASASPVSGSWKGLVFDENYVQSNSELSYCQFEYTGMQSKPAIYTGASFKVANTTITNSSITHPAVYKTGITVPPGTGNNFTWFEN
jgi:hypothetical protein